jgi:23S rRNA pseudouridine1911/1915/1917 synthase
LSVSRELDGSRLDHALARLIPGIGLRRAREIIARKMVLVDGGPRPKGCILRRGQRIDVLKDGPGESSANREFCADIVVAAENAEFAALVKPAGMHSALGRGPCCLESCLKRIFVGRSALLLNRLDRETSGLVLVGFGSGPAEKYACRQDQGLVRKGYLAVVHGLMDEGMTLDCFLDTAKRKKVRAMKRREQNSLRRTDVEPLQQNKDLGLTLVAAHILKGRRHQIRAHLADAGHPILGDALYGSESADRLYLHHFQVNMPGFIARTRTPGEFRHLFPTARSI